MLNLKKINILFFILFLPSLILASGNGIAESDFFYRVFNFTIFVALLYYLIANPIKEFFISREKNIEKVLIENREKLLKAKKDKNLANSNLEKMKDDISEIMEKANQKAEYIKEEMLSKNKLYLAQLEKQSLQNIKVEQNKITRNTIYLIFDNNILLEDITLNNSQAVQIFNDRNKDN